jgi:hypothetical protein
MSTVSLAEAQDRLQLLSSARSMETILGGRTRQPTFVGEGVEQLSPHGQRKYLWGNVPAVDILNVEQNERANISSILHLLFAGKPHLFVRAYD